MQTLALALSLTSEAQAVPPASVPKGPSTASGPSDPRSDPVWLTRDRRLRRATIGTGAFAGAMGLGLLISLGVALAPSHCPANSTSACGFEGNPVARAAMIGFGALTGVGVLVFAVVGGTMHEHREPLRRWRASLAPNGLQLRF